MKQEPDCRGEEGHLVCYPNAARKANKGNLFMYRLAVALCALLFILAEPSLAAQLEIAAAAPEPRLYALMSPGAPLEFAPVQRFEMSACVERRQDRLVLRDPISGSVEEVQGNRLEPEVGNKVRVTARVVPGVKPMDGAVEVIEITRLRRISRGCASASPAAEAPEQGISRRWNAHGFFTAGGSLAGFGGRFKGGGGGVEAYIWRGVTAGAEVSAFRDSYYGSGTERNLDHVGANVSYHFTGREKTRGMDPFVLFGAGRYFPGKSRVVVHGGGGFTYWFKPRVGARFEFRIGEWQYAEYTVGALRVGIAFR